MKIEKGDFTVGDVGVVMSVTANETLTGKTIYFIFIKPSGKTLSVEATALSGMVAGYTWQEGDLDEAGTWRLTLKNMDRPNEYQPGAIPFNVRPKTEEMAMG